jgi:hypothetical protein
MMSEGMHSLRPMARLRLAVAVLTTDRGCLAVPCQPGRGSRWMITSIRGSVSVWMLWC